MTDRRTFLTRSGLALGALLLGDDVLDAFARLTHVRKSFPSAGVPYRYAVRTGLPPVKWRMFNEGIDSPMTATEVLWRRAQRAQWVAGLTRLNP